MSTRIGRWEGPTQWTARLPRARLQDAGRRRAWPAPAAEQDGQAGTRLLPKPDSRERMSVRQMMHCRTLSRRLSVSALRASKLDRSDAPCATLPRRARHPSTCSSLAAREHAACRFGEVRARRSSRAFSSSHIISRRPVYDSRALPGRFSACHLSIVCLQRPVKRFRRHNALIVRQVAPERETLCDSRDSPFAFIGRWGMSRVSDNT